MSLKLWRLGSAAGFGLFCAVIFNACLLGGTGTGTGNGIQDDSESAPEMGLRIRYFDSLHQPVSGLTLHILPADYSPLEVEPIGFLNTSKTDSLAISGAEDQKGRHEVRFILPGTYVVTASRGDSVVAMDTVRMATKQPFDSVELSIETTKHWSGRISLESKMKLDSGWLVVYGTRYKAKVDSVGRYDLGEFPIGLRQKARLSLETYGNHPSHVIKATLAAVRGQTPISHSDSLDVKTDSMGQIEVNLPNGSAAPDTIQILSESRMGLETKSEFVSVRCVPDTVGTQAVCLETDSLVYLKDASNVSTADSIIPTPTPIQSDSLNPNQPVYLENGTVLPACSTSKGSKSSDDLIPAPAGADGDFIVLDVSANPTCEP